MRSLCRVAADSDRRVLPRPEAVRQRPHSSPRSSGPASGRCPCTRPWIALIRSKATCASRSVPKESRSMASTVRCKRRRQPQCSVRNVPWSAIPRATSGCASWSRMAGLQARSRTISRWSFEARGPARGGPSGRVTRRNVAPFECPRRGPARGGPSGRVTGLTARGSGAVAGQDSFVHIERHSAWSAGICQGGAPLLWTHALREGGTIGARTGPW